jgi:hypothetical protein
MNNPFEQFKIVKDKYVDELEVKLLSFKVFAEQQCLEGLI